MKKIGSKRYIKLKDISKKKEQAKARTEREYHQTEAQQKVLRGNMSNEANYKKKELQTLLKNFQNDLGKNNNKQ